MRNRWNWIIGGVVTMVLLFLAMNVLGDHGGFGHHGRGGFAMNGSPMGRGHHGHGGFGMFGFLVAFLSLALGWYLRKTKEKKWLGNVFIVVGLLPVWKVAVVGFIVFWAVKKLRANSSAQGMETTFSTLQDDLTNNAKFLDQWEQGVKKENK